jgi:hypothetical protein
MIEWNVYYFDINGREIGTFNIFKHYSFMEEVKKIIKKWKDKGIFASELNSSLMYYFWSKAEWELVVEITEDNRIFLIPWCGCREPEKIKIDVTNDTNLDWRSFADVHTKRQIYGNSAKIDVYNQVVFNWNLFVDYIWDRRKEILKLET